MKKYICLTLIVIFSINISFCYSSENNDLTLSRIYVEPGTLEPEFSETRDYYTLKINNDIDKVLIQATPTDINNSYTISGNENLKEGENIVNITVNSKDKSVQKNYKINILKTSVPEEYNTLLQTLIVDNYEFLEEFFPEKFEYNIESKDKINLKDLNIYAYPQNNNATVQIRINEQENNIEINTTSENKKAQRVYKINIHNISKDNNIENTDKIITNQKNKNNNIIIIILVIAILFFLLLLLYKIII